MSEAFTSLEIIEKKAIIQINRPNQLNSLNKQVLQEINNYCSLLKNNTNIQVLILCSAGDKAFIAGADIKEMQMFKSNQEAAQFSEFGSNTLSLLEKLPQIVIARIQGFALGGGLELALSSDIIIASEKASFGFPEVTLGLIPGFAGTQRLARKIGTSKAIEWITSAQKYTATEALSCGLINHVIKHDELITFTNQLSDKIIKNAPNAVRIAKMVIKEGMEKNFVEGCALETAQFGNLFDGKESKEGISAFIDKRLPKF